MAFLFFGNATRRPYQTRRQITIDAPAPIVWQAITSVEDFPSYQRCIIHSKVIQSDSERRPTAVIFEMDAMVRIVQYTLLYHYDKPGEKVSWRSEDSGSVARVRGSMEVRPLLGDPGKSSLLFSIEITPALPVPKYVRTALESTAVNHALEDLARHAQALAGTASA